MDSFFGIGGWEIVLILILALFFLGPVKIVSFARTLGKLVNNIKKASSDITQQITKEVDEQEKSLKDAAGSLKDVAGSLKNETQGQAKSISAIASEFFDDLKGQASDVSNTVSQFAGEINGQGQEIKDTLKQPVIEISNQGKSIVKSVSSIPKEIKAVKSNEIVPAEESGSGTPG